jgi:hypothetical protein
MVAEAAAERRLLLFVRRGAPAAELYPPVIT